MAMKTDAAGRQFICDREAEGGPKLAAYRDGGGTWTIGYGTIRYPDGTPVKGGDTCTAAQAMTWYLAALPQREADVNRLVNVALTQAQFNALVSFDYNEGVGNLSGSTLLALINKGRYRDAAPHFLDYDKIRVNGVLVPSAGLTRRRTLERDLFLSGTAPVVSAVQ